MVRITKKVRFEIPEVLIGEFMFNFNVFTGKLDIVRTETNIGGKYGINVETLSANKTLTANIDEIYQFLDPNGVLRTITIDTASATAGDIFVIRATNAFNDSWFMTIKQSTTTLDVLFPGKVASFIFDGTNWTFNDIGSGDATTNTYNIMIGYRANGNNYGTAVGYRASGYNNGTSIGHYSGAYNHGAAVGYYARGFTFGAALGGSAEASNYGVAVGRSSDGRNYGVAIGYYAKSNSKYDAVALGRYSETERYAEIAHNINGGDTDQENNITIGGWEGSTTNATPLEIFCGGVASQRFTIRPSSVLGFRLIITARDNVAGHVGMWTVNNGVIKRDASNNTAMATAATVTEVVDESTDWSVAVTADDTNESLKIEVTGDATNPVQWVARLDGVETHF